MSSSNNENSSVIVDGFPIPNFDDIDDEHEEKEITDDDKKRTWAPNIDEYKRNVRNQENMSSYTCSYGSPFFQSTWDRIHSQRLLPPSYD